MAAGNLLRDIYGQPWWVGLIAGAVFLGLFVLIFGRRSQPYRVEDRDIPVEV
jgi:hypothetical protein